MDFRAKTSYDVQRYHDLTVKNTVVIVDDYQLKY